MQKEILASTLINERDAQRRLNVCRSTIYKLRRTGVLPYVRIGASIRYRVADVDRLAREGTGGFGAFSSMEGQK